MKSRSTTTIETKNPFEKLYEWTSPDRVWAPKTRAWYVSYSFFFVIMIAFLALLGEYILIIALVAFAFLWFIQGAVPPTNVHNTITTLGIKSFDKLFRWRNIKKFWFSRKDSVKFLNLEISEDDNPRFIKRVSLIVNSDEDKAIFDILIQYLDYGERDEIGFNPLMRLLHGKHIEVIEYLPETSEEEPEMLDYPS